MPEIDFNSDVGEGFSLYQAGDDAAVLAHITSANIACGFHCRQPGAVAFARSIRQALLDEGVVIRSPV